MNQYNDQKICFIVVAGFAPDNVPVINIKESLNENGFDAIASSFFGDVKMVDFTDLTMEQCIDNMTDLIEKTREKYDKVFGIGISLGGAFLLEYAKNHDGLSGIISIGTPFELKNKRLIKFGKSCLPVIYPFWRILQRDENLRLIPLGAVNMVVDYLQGVFLENLDSIKTQVLFLHSKNDFVAEYSVVDRFSQEIGSEKKHCVLLEGVGHSIDYDTDLIVKHAFDFFLE